MKTIRIAIDGPSGAGKSTLAKRIARELGIIYLDTGAMYRAVALKAIRLGIDTRDRENVSRLMDDIDISVEYHDGTQRIYLDGEDVSSAIRTNEVSMGASNVSAFPEVRAKLVALQQEIARNNPVVMDGRDIGTKVLPDAGLKIFLTASVEERARRRFLELKEKGLLDKTFDELVAEIEERDRNDSTREHSPLKKAEDAVEIDSTGKSIDELVAMIMDMVRKRF
ncbi:MAG TPA: (d)CMP kinase [Thermoclostridium caenicola]|uniref:Cytidylate kinase n=1 Tax=Thermoclostridium caenicola TaxID=659425 RepID=A0A1M6GSB6_9FIRM|nr:(d)CMP kinase [Thermoclostridium caenicola]SHJ12824.1 cytidylate kinase [Thermoclostridium caenicola]HOK42414.1 (d)CMP kinase [Thermoclostridium caenicola]HOL84814.1 (d)CMP kinase [Thermoclostridium caenicola]HOP72296.1 (d)CMP kinase [Thermoclostridium caenicola]HPO76902.1 (d)CMP kinase [Thermoclostridium caenicola]